ncbi:hypothetical protein ALC57_07155 [Trachymyrmex cornetzi]|uniref:Uncharacterized protein n=1 Tax=Trachymyrmex cornetzi TaxID=471704 RepID=A0A195E589_9HYME|nr:hypothetical protein ALC57_07155 [Trachymyrmex cornetzi]
MSIINKSHSASLIRKEKTEKRKPPKPCRRDSARAVITSSSSSSPSSFALERSGARCVGETVPEQAGWRKLVSRCCSGLAEPGIWGHAYEVNEGGPEFRASIPFRGSGPARAVACENAQSADLGGRDDPVGAPDDDESTRDGPLEDRDEIVKTRQTLGAFD